MVNGSIDIPAIKFMVMCGDGIQDVNSKVVLDNKDVKVYDFDQVDGLTIKQFMSTFNSHSKNNILGLMACVDISQFASPQKNLHSIQTIFRRVADFELDMEMSAFFENVLVSTNLLDKTYEVFYTFSPEVIMTTFCARYRGREVNKPFQPTMAPNK